MGDKRRCKSIQVQNGNFLGGDIFVISLIEALRLIFSGKLFQKMVVGGKNEDS